MTHISKKIIQDLISAIDSVDLTLRHPLHKKLRMRWFFDVSKVKESSFLKIGPHWPRQIFDAHLFKNTDLSHFRFHFPVSFYIKIMFWVRWLYSLFGRMRLKRRNDVYSHYPTFNHIILYKKGTFFAESAMSQPWSAIFCATSA